MTPSTRGAAATLSRIESRFRGAIAASLDAFVLCESVRGAQGGIADFRVVELNQRAEAFLGRARDVVIGGNLAELFPTVRESGVLDQFVRVVETGESFEGEMRFGDGATARWVRYQAVCVAEDGLAIMSRDITRHKQEQQSLAESEKRFRQLVESVSDGMYRIDRHGVFTYANPIASRVLGMSAEGSGIIGRIYLEFVRRDYHEQGIALYRRQIAERIPVTYWEFPVVAADGRELWVGQNVHIEERDGMVESLFAVARDITERKRAELALRESEERHRFLADHSTDMLSRQSPDGTILYTSPVCLTLLGYAADDLSGHSVFEYCHPDDLEAVRAAYARVLGHRGVETLTYRIRRRDGHYVWFETTSHAVRDAKTGMAAEVLCVARDITARRHLEEELRQAQKMEAVGQLAGGVAHDFNNLLTAIRGFSDLLGRSLDVGDVRRKDVGEILKATERAAELTRQLLAFGRRQVLRLEPMNLNTVVEDMMKIVRRLIADDITIDVALESGAWTIRADPGQLEQVILNLALNARDAMAAGGGTLRIATRNEDGGRGTGTSRHVALEVSDTGTGMSDHTRQRIFEPFFTTKESGDRAGLGLATVYGIVTQSGGQISVESELGKGSTFTIRLPVSSSFTANARSSGAPARRSAAGNVVLMAEDNEGVRALTVRILADAGYRVIEACDGVDALETLAALGEPVDLLISDVMMPRMNGSELATRFEQEQPGTPILLMSGYMDDDTVRRAFGDPDSVLQKPFTPEALLTRVRSLIGAAR